VQDDFMSLVPIATARPQTKMVFALALQEVGCRP